LLPGLPSRHRDRLTADCRLVPGAIFRDSVYYFRVPHHCHVAGVGEGFVLPGDLLLMECDPAYWRKRPEAVAGRICACRFEEEIDLAKVAQRDDGLKVCVAVPETNDAGLRSDAIAGFGRECRAIDLGDPPEDLDDPPDRQESREPRELLRSPVIISVALCLQRDL